MLSVGVVGAGPSGIYAAEALAEHPDVRVDVLDRLPTPFGLVRYGVAPDHPKIGSIVGTLSKTLRHSRIRFLGNVDVGRTVAVDELRGCYDALILATGASLDRRLGIPGEDAHGSYSATDLVAWYEGHPDRDLLDFVPHASCVAVIGGGNVALDICRILTRPSTDFAQTDMPSGVLAALARSPVRTVHLVIRRGPERTKFASKELSELGELDGVAISIDPEDLRLEPADEAILDRDRAAARNVAVLRRWAQRPWAAAQRSIVLHFNSRPVAIIGSDTVQAMRLERTETTAEGQVVGTGACSDLPVGMVVRAIGYQSAPIPGVEFDQERCVIPNEAGRVIACGRPVEGLYVTGWVKRGPAGIIGTNRHDSVETVRTLMADLADGALRRKPKREAVDPLLETRGAEVVPWQ